MSRFIIQGGHPLSGTIRPVGNKNAVLPMLAASLLTDEPVTLLHVPQIEDVQSMLVLLEHLGVAIEQRGRTLTLCAATVRQGRLDASVCRKVRSSILLAGPLVARHGEARLFPPGGDVIGRRRLDTHFAGLRALGVTISVAEHYTFKQKRLRAADLILDEASVTATENIMMAATLAPGTTTILNAACEPHVADLGRLLNGMGAAVRGLGTNRLEIDGVERLHGTRHTVEPDYIEVGSFLAAAAVTRGALTVEKIPELTPFRVMAKSFEKLGVRWQLGKDRLHFKAPASLRVQKDLGAVTPKIEDGIWPAFPSDLMSVAIVLATQAKGSVLFFEKLFESRMYFVDHLIAMGANIVQCDPHRVLVSGPARLHGTHLTSPDIRAGMSLIIAALCAKGESVIENAQVVDRGYEKIDRRLRKLGARIVRKN